MYKSKIFDDYNCELDLVAFLNSNDIDKEDIISICMSSDSKAIDRVFKKNIDRILLVYTV